MINLSPVMSYLLHYEHIPHVQLLLCINSVSLCWLKEKLPNTPNKEQLKSD
jgi:hypothetical protein